MVDTLTVVPGGKEKPEPVFHALEAEQALLGAILLNNEAYYLAAAIVGPGDFYEALHARIFDWIGARINAGEKATALTIIPDFRFDTALIGLGGKGPESYFASLIGQATTVVNTPEYAKLIRDMSIRRKASRAIKELAFELQDESGSGAVELIQRSLGGLIEADTGAGKRIDLRTSTDGVIERINTVKQTGVSTEKYAYPGSATLRRAIGGWRPGRYYIIAARPGMGKTTCALSWLLRTTGKNHGVLFFSQEMTADELAEKAMTDIAYERKDRIEYEAVSRNDITDDQFQRLYEAKGVLDTLPMIIDDRANLTLMQMRAAIAQERLRRDIRVVAVDHLGLVRASERYAGNKVAETEEVSLGLKAIAKDFGVAVVALCQLSRAVEGRDDKRPTLADLRWSGAIEQDADTVMFLYREAYYLAGRKCDDAVEEEARLTRLNEIGNLIEAGIAKNRGGKTQVLQFFCDMGCSVVRDLERETVNGRDAVG